MPPLREGDRYFLGLRRNAATALCRLPKFNKAQRIMNLAYEACALQFTKRRIRTFITIPSARNMNNTEDPP
jgi:hypothetical protein